ncbi:uncharacterized protein LOC117119018 [Anneissia japonica]|uniref:uncharacterized protein LOC117119018 n=1 Tax=Anneissia japonica TaxID=1529436 RepID=UPI0014259358|nr:uncharacterized protein LOC117119018 [Anneissia japonica]
MDTATCSCVVGGPCKHQHIVYKYFSINNINTSPVNSPSLRKIFYTIATGCKMHDQWFSSLKSGESENANSAVDHEHVSPLPDADACLSDSNTQPSMDVGSHHSSDIDTDLSTNISLLRQHEEQEQHFIELLKEKELKHLL